MVPTQSQRINYEFLSLEVLEQEYWVQQDVAKEFKENLAKRIMFELFGDFIICRKLWSP